MTDIIKNHFDAVDRRIAAALNADGRITDVALGDQISLSSTAVARRRKLMEESRLITGYSANIDPAQLGFNTTVLVSVELNSQSAEALTAFEDAVTECSSISWCSFVSGDADFLMIVHARSLEDYYRIYRAEFSNLPHVAKIKSSFVMREVTKLFLPPVMLKG